ncbi:MAG TPA: reverse transcriptase domain-containing protein [Gemmataceae bacterium]
MSSPTVQFITRMKLRELRKQRAELNAAYARLAEEVAAKASPGERLRALYDGLRGITFAAQPLHPEVVNLDILLDEAAAATAPADVLALWESRLERELAAGRARCEFVYLFGALLEEWARGTTADRRGSEESHEQRRRLLAEATAAPPPNRHADVLDPLFAEGGPGGAGEAERLRKECAQELYEPVGEYLDFVIDQMAEDIYQPPRLRSEARQFAANPQWTKELADALTILCSELRTWDWPAEGVGTRALWTRNKWRLYLDLDLPTAALAAVIGDRLAQSLSEITNAPSPAERQAHLQKLLDLKAPEVIVANDRRMLEQAPAGGGRWEVEPADPWRGGKPPPDVPAEAGSVVVARIGRQRSLRGGGGGGYEREYGGVHRAAMLVNAEVRLARAAFPDRPLFVVKTDLRDYYASIPHDVLLTALTRMGVGDPERDLVARLLAVTVRGDDGRPAKLRRGVPMGLSLSGTLAELLMRLAEEHLHRRANVRIVRLVDDVCFLTPEANAAVAAWEAMRRFCDACGLEINEEKSGALALGADLPAGLPSQLPRWGDAGAGRGRRVGRPRGDVRGAPEAEPRALRAVAVGALRGAAVQRRRAIPAQLAGPGGPAGRRPPRGGGPGGAALPPGVRGRRGRGCRGGAASTRRALRRAFRGRGRRL